MNSDSRSISIFVTRDFLAPSLTGLKLVNRQLTRTCSAYRVFPTSVSQMIRTLFVEEESSLSEARAGSIYHPAAPSYSIFETIETMNTHFLSNRSLTLVLVTLLGAIYRIECFQPTTTQGFQTRFSTELAAESSTASIATLTDATTWTMRMSLDNLPTEKGKKTGGIYVVQAKFIEEEGYEPPQGLLQQCFPEDAASEEDEADTEEEKSSAISQMTVSTGRWTLSEDPDDRKDGLWYVKRRRAMGYVFYGCFVLHSFEIFCANHYMCLCDCFLMFPFFQKGLGPFQRAFVSLFVATI